MPPDGEVRGGRIPNGHAGTAIGARSDRSAGERWGFESRAAGALSRADRAARPGREQRGNPRHRARPQARRPSRCGAARRPVLGSAPRSAHDRKGLLRDSRPADHGRGRRTLRPCADRQCRRSPAAPRRRRHRLRQDEHADLGHGLADPQQTVRHHQQSLGSRADLRRLVGRIGRLGGGGIHGARTRQRHRRVGPDSLALLRRVRAQTELGNRSRARTHPGPAGKSDRRRHQRDRPAGPQRGRSRDRPTGPDGPIGGPGKGLATGASRTTRRASTGLPGRRLAR